jgi:hypothetical protein
MHLVAIAKLEPAADLGALAAELGTTAYELKLTLAAGLPAVVSVCADATRAGATLLAVQRHGHRALAFDRDQVVPSARMVALREFRFEARELVADAARSERLAYDEILAFYRATHRTSTTTKEEVKEKKLRPGMAIATGGLIMSKTTKREVVTETTAHEQVLYLFPRDGGPAWILRERSARYAGLGGALSPTSLANFTTTMQRLRQLAPGAAYDDRLLHSRPIRGVADGPEAADIIAHLMAADLARP